MSYPAISVILPVFNAEEFVAESMQSILNQTFEDFELLVINDGSTDRSKDIILSFQDKRIKYIDNRNNQGLIRTLNKGLYFAKGEFIARMDADDLCKANRFEKQVDFFRQDNEVDILGAYQYVINENRYINHKKTNEENRIHLLLEPPVAHSSVLVKRNKLHKSNLYYDKNAIYAEDYKLWIDASLSGLSIKNIDEYLCGYRFHQNQISNKHSEFQKYISHQLRLRYAYRFFDSTIIGREIEYLSFILGLNVRSKDAFYKKIIKIYEDLLIENLEKKYFEIQQFEMFMTQRLFIFKNNQE